MGVLVHTKSLLPAPSLFLLLAAFDLLQFAAADVVDEAVYGDGGGFGRRYLLSSSC